MRIIGCDLHVSQQTLAMLDRETGEITEHSLEPSGTDAGPALIVVQHWDEELKRLVPTK